MIQITITEKHDLFKSFTIEGHSLIGKKGNNILCAGVSTLVQTIFLGLKEILKLNVKFDKKDGYFHCYLPENLTQSNKQFVDLLIMTMIKGLQDLKKQYPDEVSINWETK